jgi:UDP-N-acetylmuramoyl-L-alanyl-D-glutamate--2,6-diaminopimelate ligase
MSHDQRLGVRLDTLFSPAARTTADGAIVTGCTSDWRKVQPGDAFVAVLDEEADGHDLAERAVKRGATAVIAEQPIPIFNVPVYHVDDTRIALGELCHALAGHPSRRLRVIAVIGAQGKSTTIALLESIFTAAGHEVGVLSTLKSYDGMTRSAGIDESISPSLLAGRLARMEAAGCTHALVEVSSQSLAQYKLAGIELDTVVTTSIDSARLDLHHTTQNYRDAQRRVLEYLSPAGVAIINADDPVGCRWLAELDAPSLTYGLNDQAQIAADIVEQNACETVFVLAAGADSAAIRTTIIGEHHVSNCLAAAATALAHGIELQTIARGIEAVQKLPARMERVDCGQDFAVFIDAAANACGLRSTLRTARKLSRGRVICVLGDELPTNSTEASAIRGVVEKLADVAIVTDALTELDSGWLPIESDDSSKIQVAADRSEAMAFAVAAASEGDVVVIAGSRGPTGFGFGQNEVTDAEVVRELLYGLAQPALRLVA